MLINFDCQFLLKPNKFQKELKISIVQKLSSKMMIFEIPSMGGNAKKRGFTIHNRNALKIHTTHTHTQLEEVRV